MEDNEYDGEPLQNESMLSSYHTQQQQQHKHQQQQQQQQFEMGKYQQFSNPTNLPFFSSQPFYPSSHDQFSNPSDEWAPDPEDGTVFIPPKVINTPFQDLELLRKLKLDILAGVYPQFVRSRPLQSFQDRLDKLNKEQEQETYDSIPLPTILPASLPARPSFAIVNDITSLPLNTDTSIRMSIHANRVIPANSAKKLGKKISTQKETRGQMKDREARELLTKKEILRKQAEEESLLVARKEAQTLAKEIEVEIDMEYSDSESIDGDELMITTVLPIQESRTQKLNVNAPEFYANTTSVSSALPPSFPPPPPPASASSNLTTNPISPYSRSPVNSLSNTEIPTGPRIFRTTQSSPKLSSASIPLGPKSMISPRQSSRIVPAVSSSTSLPSHLAKNLYSSSALQSHSTSITQPLAKDKIVIDDRWGRLVARNTAVAIAANGGSIVQSRHSTSGATSEKRSEPLVRDDRRSFDERSYASTSFGSRARSRSPPFRQRSRSPPPFRTRSRSPPLFQMRSRSPPPFRMRSRSPPLRNSSFNSPRSLPDIDDRYPSRKPGRSREPFRSPVLRRDDRFAQLSSPSLLNRRLDISRPLSRSGSDSRISLSNGSPNINGFDGFKSPAFEQQRSNDDKYARASFSASNSPRLARALSPRGHFDDRIRQGSEPSDRQNARNVPRSNSVAPRAPPPRLLETNNERSQPQTRQDSQSRAPQVLSQHFGFVQDQEFNSQQEYDERERRDIRFASVATNSKNSSRQPSYDSNDNRYASPVYFPPVSSAPSNQSPIAPLSARLSVGLEGGNRGRNVNSKSSRPSAPTSLPPIQSRSGSNLNGNKNNSNNDSAYSNNNSNSSNNGHNSSFFFNSGTDSSSGRHLGSHNVTSNPSSQPPYRGMSRNGNNNSSDNNNSNGY